jgi:toxin YoeB
LPRSVERQAIFHPEFQHDLRDWVETDRKVALRASGLIEAVLRGPLVGIEKPEPLKSVLAGYWSHRITEENRPVYRVSAGRIDFLQARYHYPANFKDIQAGSFVAQRFYRIQPGGFDGREHAADYSDEAENHR